MILNNYFNFIGNTPRFEADIGGSDASADIGLIDTNGDSVSWQYGGGGIVEGNARIINNFIAWHDLSIILAADTDDPTASDFDISDDVTSDFAGLTVSITSGADTGSAKLTVTISGTNTSGSSVTVTEICLVKKVWTDANSGTYKSVLFIKHKLSIPLTLAAGASFTTNFEWALS